MFANGIHSICGLYIMQAGVSLKKLTNSIGYSHIILTDIIVFIHFSPTVVNTNFKIFFFKGVWIIKMAGNSTRSI